MSSTQIMLTAWTREEFLEKINRCYNYLTENVATPSPWSDSGNSQNAFCFWGEGQTWVIKEIVPGIDPGTPTHVAEVWVDDSVAATLVALLV